LAACDISVPEIFDSTGSLSFREHIEVAQVLSGLHVWQEAAIPGGLPGWIMNSAFKRNMKIALLGG
jgi:transcription initiation factor TFIIH subunit 4